MNDISSPTKNIPNCLILPKCLVMSIVFFYIIFCLGLHENIDRYSKIIYNIRIYVIFSNNVKKGKIWKISSLEEISCQLLEICFEDWEKFVRKNCKISSQSYWLNKFNKFGMLWGDFS